MQVPAWKVWLADILNMDRFARLRSSIVSSKKNKRFLKSGEVVKVSGGILGEIETQIVQ